MELLQIGLVLIGLILLGFGYYTDPRIIWMMAVGVILAVIGGGWFLLELLGD